MTEYTNVGIPKALASKLQKCVGHGGWRSLTEIILYCIRQRMFQFDQLLEEIREMEESKGESSLSDLPDTDL